MPSGPAPITSLLAYLDGKATLPGEPLGDDNKTPIGAPVTVAGVDLSRNTPLKLPAVTSPGDSRVVRAFWAPKGTLLATLVRQPIRTGFSDNLDLVVIDIASGKTTTIARAINTIPSWSPDGTALVYGILSGNDMDVHVARADGAQDRVITHLTPIEACGAGGRDVLADPIDDFVNNDQFLAAQQQTAWAVDNSRIAIVVGYGAYTFQPDGSDIRRPRCGLPMFTDLTALIGGPTTNDSYTPTNGAQVRLQDDENALIWRYEQGLFPTDILRSYTVEGDVPKGSCNNTKKTTANAGYRNQIVIKIHNS